MDAFSSKTRCGRVSNLEINPIKEKIKARIKMNKKRLSNKNSSGLNSQINNFRK